MAPTGCPGPWTAGTLRRSSPTHAVSNALGHIALGRFSFLRGPSSGGLRGVNCTAHRRGPSLPPTTTNPEAEPQRTPRVLFCIGGVGLGNSTRCDAIIDQLDDVDIQIVAFGNATEWFTNKGFNVHRLIALPLGANLWMDLAMAPLTLLATLANICLSAWYQLRIRPRRRDRGLGILGHPAELVSGPLVGGDQQRRDHRGPVARLPSTRSARHVLRPGASRRDGHAVVP